MEKVNQNQKKERRSLLCPFESVPFFAGKDGFKEPEKASMLLYFRHNDSVSALHR